MALIIALMFAFAPSLLLIVTALLLIKPGRISDHAGFALVGLTLAGPHQPRARAAASAVARRERP